MISGEDMTSLTWLKMHYERYYQISFADGVWQALPADGGTGVLTADNAVKLRDAMRDDLAAKAAHECRELLGIGEPCKPDAVIP